MNKIFSLLFLCATLGAAAVNVAVQASALRGDLSELVVPDSFAAFRRDTAAIEGAAGANITEQPLFVDIYSLLQVAMGKEEVGDFTVVKASNGMLNRGDLYPQNMYRLREFAARVYWMKRFLGDRDGRLIFLSPPNRSTRGAATYRAGMPFQNLNPVQDSFLHHLREYDVGYLDSRLLLRRAGISPDRWVFKTDFNWTIEACFEVYRGLVTALNQEFFANLDSDGYYRDKANYTARSFGRFFLGSLGKYTGEAFGGMDDFTLLAPKYKPNAQFIVEMVDPREGFITRKGAAEETLLDEKALSRLEDSYAFHPYDFYASGNKTWSKIRNVQHPAGPRVLLIHDGFGAPLASFLAPLFGETHTILARGGAFGINIDQYLTDYRFDYVIVELSADSFNDTGMNFFIGPKD